MVVVSGENELQFSVWGELKRLDGGDGGSRGRVAKIVYVGRLTGNLHAQDNSWTAS